MNPAQQKLMDELTAIRDPQARFAYIIRRARSLPALPVEMRTDANRVEGCLSELWLVGEIRDGKCYFKADCNSAVVKGVASLLCEYFSGCAPEEILSSSPEALAEAGITQHLTANRRDSLSHVWRRIRAVAEEAARSSGS